MFERRPIRSGRQTVTFTVDREPRFAGIDPYNKRIDRNSDDNVMAVTRASATAARQNLERVALRRGTPRGAALRHVRWR